MPYLYTGIKTSNMLFQWHYDSPLGGITLASDGTSLTGLWFDGQKYFGNTLDEEPEEKIIPVFEETCRWLDIYFSGRKPGFTPPLAMQASPFRKAVWEILPKRGRQQLPPALLNKTVRIAGICFHRKRPFLFSSGKVMQEKQCI